MSANKKPRKAYRPKPVCTDTMRLAQHFAAKPSAQDRGEVLGMLNAAIKALREGQATEDQWSVVAGSVTVAMAIEHQGIVRGLKEPLMTADDALQTIYARATATGQWTRVTLYFHELDAISQFVELHTFQVNQLGRAEFLKAVDAAHKKIRAKGQRCTLIRNPQPERMAA